MGRFAVIDIETTGLSTAYGHRVLEIAIVHVNDRGEVVYEWDTLLNPERDVSATEIHGISAADVVDAPTFPQIAGDLATLLRGKVPVAHNLAFDAPFLAAEFALMGIASPLNATNGLCTMRMAHRYLPYGRRTLQACCDRIGYSIQNAHSALDDARATAYLLAYYIKKDGDFLVTWEKAISAAQYSLWPDIPAATARRLSRNAAAAAAATVAATAAAADEEEPVEFSDFTLKPGDAVVFTGEAVGIDRAELEQQARHLGLRVSSSVSGRTRLVVAANPTSNSTKAKRARELGIPIMDYETYMQVIEGVAGSTGLGL